MHELSNRQIEILYSLNNSKCIVFSELARKYDNDYYAPIYRELINANLVDVDILPDNSDRIFSLTERGRAYIDYVTRQSAKDKADKRHDWHVQIVASISGAIAGGIVSLAFWIADKIFTR